MTTQSNNHVEEISIDNLTYEQALAMLEETVTALESGEHPLDQALFLFERGQALVQRCETLLDQAQLKVKILSGEDLTDFQTETF
jgi:exodeoxyribonuclease VII small subunit